MINQHARDKKLYGLATLGEKGQVIVPAEARRLLKLKKGDKLLVFGFGDMIAFATPADLEKMAGRLAERLTAIKGIIEKNERSFTGRKRKKRTAAPPAMRHSRKE